MDMNEWVLPETGVLECDFVYLAERPNPEEILSEKKVESLVNWFRIKYEEEK